MEMPRKRRNNTGIRYLIVCLTIKYIKTGRFPFMMPTAVNKDINKFNFKEVIVCALTSLIQIKKIN
jgi:hypothetical protein